MAKIVLIGSNRIGLARVRDALARAGNLVEMGTNLSDARILARAVSADVVIIDFDDTIARDLPLVETLAKGELDLEVVLLVPPMPPALEQELIAGTQSLGVHMHLPRQMTSTPYFASVIGAVADRRRLRQAHKQLGSGIDVIRAGQPPDQQDEDVPIPDYAFLQEHLREQLQIQRDISLMIIGIDNLQAIQQRRGLRSAEQFMQDLAGLLLTDLRDTDVVATTPAVEKLAVSLPETPAMYAKRVAGRIQVKLARRSLGVVTVSAGIAEAGESTTAEDLIRTANKAWDLAQQTEEKLVVLTEKAA